MNQLQKKQLFRLAVYLLLAVFVLIYVWLCQNGMGVPCLLYERLQIRCPSCGASRAFLALLRLDLAEAVRQNAPFALAVYPIAALIAGQDFLLCLYNLCRRTDRISFLRFLFGARDEAKAAANLSAKKEELS